MRKQFLFFVTLFYLFTSNTLAQNSPDFNKKIDSLHSLVKEEINNQLKDTKISNWQLHNHIIYEKYPDSIEAEVQFTKGKEFLNLSNNGEYNSILNNNFILFNRFNANIY